MGLLDFLAPYTYYYTHRAGNVKRKSKKIFRQCATILGMKFVENFFQFLLDKMLGLWYNGNSRRLDVSGAPTLIN